MNREANVCWVSARAISGARPSGRHQIALTVYIFNREGGWVCCYDRVNSALRVFLALRIKKLGKGAERDPDRRVSGHEHASGQDQAHDLFCQFLLALGAGEFQCRLDLLLDQCMPFPMNSTLQKICPRRLEDRSQ